MEYAWIREDHRRVGNNWYLKPSGSNYATGIKAIANVSVRNEFYPKRCRYFVARYFWSDPTFRGVTREFGSVPAAKAWVETELRALPNPTVDPFNIKGNWMTLPDYD